MIGFIGGLFCFLWGFWWANRLNGKHIWKMYETAYDNLQRMKQFTPRRIEDENQVYGCMIAYEACFKAVGGKMDKHHS